MIAPKIQIDPMREGHPEPFFTPNTIPNAWDMTDFFFNEDFESRVDVNGTAFDKNIGHQHELHASPENAV